MHVSRLKRAVVVGLGVLAMALTGCGTANTNLLEANRALQDRNTALTAQNESLNRLNQELQAAIAARDAALSEAQALIAALQSGKAGLEGQLSSFQDKFGSLRFGDLNVATDAQTDQALRELAAQHPDILEYDAARGLLRFRSDLTFSSGSDEVSSGGRSTLTQLSGILNGPAAAYDIRIVGHTDSQRISSKTSGRHPTNMHLSAHRAISTRDVLVGTGVAATRVEVAGRGEFDPLVTNASNGNTPQNRRVELFLVRGTGGRGVSAPSASPAAPARGTPAPVKVTPRSNEDIMK